MNLLTDTEFYISLDIKEEIMNNFEDYQFTLKFIPENTEFIPLLHFSYHSIERYKNLEIKLQIQQQKEEFSVNSYFFLVEQIEFYKESEIQIGICRELAFNDLLNIYESYNSDVF